MLILLDHDMYQGLGKESVMRAMVKIVMTTRYIDIYIFMKTVLKNYPSKQILSQKSKQVTNY